MLAAAHLSFEMTLEYVSETLLKTYNHYADFDSFTVTSQD